MLNTSGLVIPHETAAPSCQRLRESHYRRRVSRRYFCSLVLKMSPSDLIQAVIRQRSGSDQPGNPPASRGRAVSATPICAHPPTDPRPQGGRAATAGGDEAGRPPQGSWQPPCRYTRPLSRPLHSRIPAPRPLSCAGRPPSSLIPCRAWPPLLYSPLRRPFTPSIPPCAGPPPSSSGPYSPL